MMRIAHAALIAFGVMSVSTATAAAQGVYNIDIFILPTSNPAPSLTFGVDAGSGFVFDMLTDDDGDGLIELPPVPAPGRLALGVSDAGGVVWCDIWSFMSNGVHEASVPLLKNAQPGESFGIDYGELMAPPLTLTPGQQFTVADGLLPQWPEIRLVDESSVPNLETFVQVVDTLPGFTGQVMVSDITVHFTLVPEPSSAALLTICLIAVGYLRRRRN